MSKHSKPGQQEHAAHRDDPPWRGQVGRAMPGGGWESVEVLIPAASLSGVAAGDVHQRNTLDVVLGRVENWFASISVRVRK